MWRAFVIISCVLALFFGGLSSGATASPEIQRSVLLKGFWFGDGFLADDPRYTDWYVIPLQAVKLYESPSLTTSIVGEMPAGAKGRIHDIAFEAYPDFHKIRVNTAASSKDGLIRLEPGSVVGLVCFQGDALASYVGDDLVLLDVYGLKLRDQIKPEWRFRLSGANQWLQLWTPEGKVGWVRFYGDLEESARGRWQIQPRAVGGGSNFNSIVFSDTLPQFQRLPYVTTH